MKQTRDRAQISVAVLAGLLASTQAYAGPTIIRDVRVSDTATTPVLGRGYSISTNTFQSACLKDVVVTEPSYDFEYEFLDSETAKAQSDVISGTGTTNYASRWATQENKSSSAWDSKTQKNTQNIQVTLNMDTYYASVDEAGTSLADSAAALLEGQDLPGFFAACGPYYTRSINRKAQLSSILSYESATAQTDYKFEQQVKYALSSAARRYTAQAAELRATEGQTALTKDFTNEASDKRLRITTRGWGIGKDKEAALIATDVDGFRDAVKKAFMAMQNPLTGRVTSIEIVPWVENAQFQTLVNMRGEDFVSQQEVPLYEKKDILTYNSEFLTDLQRQGRHILNMHYKAKLCESWMRSNWVTGNAIDSSVADLALRNHRAPGQSIKVSQLWDALVGETSVATQFRENYMNFMYNGDKSAMRCIHDLFQDPTDAAALPGALLGAAGGGLAAAGGQIFNPGTGRGLFLKRYFEHKICQEKEADFGAIELPQVVEDYCMPEVVVQIGILAEAGGGAAPGR